MWWSEMIMRRSTATLAGVAALAACLLTGCAHDGVSAASTPPPALTPLDQFPLRASETPTELALAPHPGGLSSNQRIALSDFVRSWREAGSGPLIIRAPEGAPGAGLGAAAANGIARDLVAGGVPQGAIQVTGYPAQGGPGAPVLVSFVGTAAVVPDCSRNWDNVVATRNNDVKRNFGCAEHANMAVMIADPREIDTPHRLDPADATRRAEVMAKYRKGDRTSSERDDQAKGTVSSKIQ